jgi:hypothetical protein
MENLGYIVNNICNSVRFDLGDSTELFCYYLTRKELQLDHIINFGDEKYTINELQRIGVVFLKSKPCSLYQVELTYCWFKILLISCKNKVYKKLLTELCAVFEKDFSDGKEFENFNLLFVCLKLQSFHILKEKKITIQEIYHGATFSKRLSDQYIDVPENFQPVKLKTQYMNDEKIFYDIYNKIIKFNKETIYKNGSGANYSDTFFFADIDQTNYEIDQQFKYEKNPKYAKNELMTEYKKVFSKKLENQKFYFIFCTTGIVGGFFEYENIIVIEQKNLLNYYGEAFSMKFLNSAKLDACNEIQKEDFQSTNLNQKVIDFIDENKKKTDFNIKLKKMVKNFPTFYQNFNIDGEIDQKENDINDEQTKKRKNDDEINEKNKKIKF